MRLELLWYGNGEAYDGGMSAQHIPRMSLAEFLEMEEQAECKSEFWDGQMLAMSGGTFNHARIGTNLIHRLSNALENSPCQVINSELLVQAAPGELVAYPDLTVICGEIQFVPPKELVATNPTLIIEVLSPSTELRDRGEKSAAYRRSESLRQYVLVESRIPHIEVYTKSDNGIWFLRDWDGLEGVCEFASINCRVPMSEIYDKARFTDTQTG